MAMTVGRSSSSSFYPGNTSQAFLKTVVLLAGRWKGAHTLPKDTSKLAYTFPLCLSVCVSICLCMCVCVRAQAVLLLLLCQGVTEIQ